MHTELIVRNWKRRKKKRNRKSILIQSTTIYKIVSVHVSTCAHEWECVPLARIIAVILERNYHDLQIFSMWVRWAVDVFSFFIFLKWFHEDALVFNFSNYSSFHGNRGIFVFRIAKTAHVHIEHGVDRVHVNCKTYIILSTKKIFRQLVNVRYWILSSEYIQLTRIVIFVWRFT